MNSSRNSESNLPPKYVGFNRRTQNYRKWRLLQKVATNYYLYTAEGERLFCERHNCRIYPDNRGVYWHFKVADYPAYTLPSEISRAYLNHEISMRDVYVYWWKNGR